MNVQQTIENDSRAYRQGLVLGLTMAEVILLLIFALLIAIATLWKHERDRRVSAEGELDRYKQAQAVENEHPLVLRAKDMIAKGKEKQLNAAIEAMETGATFVQLDGSEQKFIEKVREAHKGIPKQQIDDNWRELILITEDLPQFRRKVVIADMVTTFAPDGPSQLKEKLEKAKAVESALPGKSSNQVQAFLKEAIKQSEGEHDWPPIINLSETEGYSFERGSADLSPAFREHIKAVIVPQLIKNSALYKTDIIEVLGHTDEQAVLGKISTLDQALLPALRTDVPVMPITPADNAGLGLARAVSVVRELLASGEFQGLTILPLSGGQLIDVNDKIAEGRGGDAKERRRIQIRLRRSVQ